MIHAGPSLKLLIGLTHMNLFRDFFLATEVGNKKNMIRAEGDNIKIVRYYHITYRLILDRKKNLQDLQISRFKEVRGSLQQPFWFVDLHDLSRIFLACQD